MRLEGRSEDGEYRDSRPDVKGSSQGGQHQYKRYFATRYVRLNARIVCCLCMNASLDTGQDSLLLSGIPWEALLVMN